MKRIACWDCCMSRSLLALGVTMVTCFLRTVSQSAQSNAWAFEPYTTTFSPMSAVMNESKSMTGTPPFTSSLVRVPPTARMTASGASESIRA